MNWWLVIRSVFDFWTMAAIISALICMILVVIVKAGPVGRFFLGLNLFPGPKTILIAQDHTSEIKFYRTSSRGRNLRIKKEQYVFLSDLRRSADPDKPLPEKDREFNEMIKASGHIDGKPVIFGSIVASVGANPHLMEAISTAKTPNAQNLLKGIRKGLEETDAKIQNMKILADYNLNDLSQLMNIVITPQRLESVFMEGEIAGMNRYRQRDQILMGVIIVLAIGMCIMAFFLAK